MQLFGMGPLYLILKIICLQNCTYTYTLHFHRFDLKKHLISLSVDLVSAAFYCCHVILITYDATIKLVSMTEKENHTSVIMRTSNFFVLDSHIISPGQVLVLRKKLWEFLYSTLSLLIVVHRT